VIADALQIVRCLDRADDEAEVARHRLLERQERDREPLDLDLERVELAVGGDDGVGLAGVLLQQRLDGQLDQRLRALGHVQQAPLERVQLLVEMAVADGGLGGLHPNLPVT
jgi:hypothetical protein